VDRVDSECSIERGVGPGQSTAVASAQLKAVFGDQLPRPPGQRRDHVHGVIDAGEPGARGGLRGSLKRAAVPEPDLEAPLAWRDREVAQDLVVERPRLDGHDRAKYAPDDSARALRLACDEPGPAHDDQLLLAARIPATYAMHAPSTVVPKPNVSPLKPAM